jgi:hypothetical protein
MRPLWLLAIFLNGRHDSRWEENSRFFLKLRKSLEFIIKNNKGIIKDNTGGKTMKGKKLFFILGIILIIIIILVIIRFCLISPSTPKSTFVMRINTRSLEPELKSGSAIEVNKNFLRNDLKEGTIVLYKKGKSFAIKRIYKIENGKYYVENNESSEIIHISDIAGVAKKIF